MRKYLIILGLVIFFFSCNLKTHKEKTSNQLDTNKSEIVSKQEYLDYFESIKGKGCISGQFIRWNYNASLEEISTTYDTSGQWVGMLGADYYANFQDSMPSPGCQYNLPNTIIGSYYEKNGLVNLSVHFVNPQNEGSAWNNSIDFDSLLIKDSRIQKRFFRELDSVATGMRNIQKTGVMIMFRPFHEMNGGWFWWGQQERYTELWHITYDYIVNQKGLKNLLWCWSPNIGGAFNEYYPGDEYVDIVGLDAYSSDLAKDCKESYHRILKYGKPFGFSEYGCVGGGAKKADTFDYSLFLDWLKNDFPETVYFLVWRDHWGFAGQQGVKDLLNDTLIINKGGIVELKKR